MNSGPRYQPTHFDSDDKREELLRRLNAVPGIAIPGDAINRYPSIPLSVLENEQALRQFTEVFRWVIDEIKMPSNSHDLQR